MPFMRSILSCDSPIFHVFVFMPIFLLKEKVFLAVEETQKACRIIFLIHHYDVIMMSCQVSVTAKI